MKKKVLTCYLTMRVRYQSSSRFIFVDIFRTLGKRCDCQLFYFVTFIKDLLIFFCFFGVSQESFSIFPSSKHGSRIRQPLPAILVPLFSIMWFLFSQDTSGVLTSLSGNNVHIYPWNNFIPSFIQNLCVVNILLFFEVGTEDAKSHKEWFTDK